MPKIAEFYAELGLKKDKFDSGMNEAGKSTSKLNSAFKGLAVGIASAFSIRAIGQFIKSSMEAYDVQAKAEAGLLMALKGRKSLQEELIQQAGALQSETLFGDEETIGAQKQLAVMGLTGKQIKDLIPLIQDYSTVTGQDLNSASMLVAKSIMTGTNALSRYGVELDTTMSAAEKAAEVQRIFNERYGGQAAAAAQVGTGAMKQASMAFGDFSEIVGGIISKALSPWFSELTATLATTTNTLNSDAIPAWKKFFGMLNVGIGHGNDLEAQAYQKWKENNGKELNGRLEGLDLRWQEINSQRAFLKERNATNKATEEKIRLQKQDKLKEQLEQEKKAAEDARKAFEEYTDQINEIRSQGADMSNIGQVGANLLNKDDINDIVIEMPEIEPVEIPIDVQKFNDQLAEARDSWEQFTTSLQNMAEDFVAGAISQIAEGIGEAIGSGEGMQSVFSNILGLFGSFLKQMGGLMVMYGVAQLALFNSWELGPVGAIALIGAGAALGVIGGIMSGAAKKMSQGGTAGTTGSGGGGSYENSVTGYGNNAGMGYVLSTDISGDDLRIIMKRADRNATRRF